MHVFANRVKQLRDLLDSYDDIFEFEPQAKKQTILAYQFRKPFTSIEIHNENNARIITFMREITLLEKQV